MDSISRPLRDLTGHTSSALNAIEVPHSGTWDRTNDGAIPLVIASTNTALPAHPSTVVRDYLVGTVAWCV